jgi:amino-acid N-acetyltransferase
VIELVKAKLSDIPAMQVLVASEVKEGVILNRSEDEVATNIRSYVLAKDGEKLVGYTAVEEEVLVLTYLPAFFEKLGFNEINKEAIHEHKIWADCIKCIHFPVCNEIALVYKLS